jgi:hypothetical protein
MTDFTTTVAAAADDDSWLQKDRELSALQDEIRPANKNGVFDALAKAGITGVIVAFDGCGDSGQIERIDAWIGDKPAELPAAQVEIATARWGSPNVDRNALPIAEAIEALAYDFLRGTHEGWENNAGAFGEFTFDVTSRAITLDYNERFESSEYHQHVF